MYWIHVSTKLFLNPDRLCLFCIRWVWTNTLSPTQNGRHFVDDVFISFFFYENCWISIQISVKYILRVLINDDDNPTSI